MRYKNTELMLKIKDFIESCFEENHRMPAVREIAKEMSVAPSCVHRYLVEMDEREMISYRNGRMSTEKIDKMNFQTNNAALVGSIPCGVPDMREAHIENYMPLPVSIFGSDELYILHADGDSMTGVGIEDGDLVVIKKQHQANVGDVVVALDGENQNTLKTLCYDDDERRYYLHPENDRYDDIYVLENPTQINKDKTITKELNKDLMKYQSINQSDTATDGIPTDKRWIDRYNQNEMLIKNNIEYKALLHSYDKSIVDEIVSVMTEVLTVDTAY